MNKDNELYKQLIINGSQPPSDTNKIKSIIEALLFTAGEPLELSEISGVIQINKNTAKKLLNELIDEYNIEDRGIQIINFNNKFQMCTRPEHKEYIKRLLKPQNKQSLSRAAIETVAIIAYKQPITRQSIDSIRGVKCDRLIHNLMDKKLIKEVGRADAPGRPALYGTTDNFLRYFGLKNLDELPELENLNINA
ncbi:segregation and condensation protein B [Oxobacter pfennigii]|uniref:Segregation and condensation protein B n=1 Tax=Oxobacter pfennigii TaxID=36849 RepID=A0A0N8NTH8_9CLOT|nr:SMC-Scp complex subunit ScpB [Oxobacter pfennigii]KPU44872.1 segregation and condensation protein B [Oxobacter pfennigii]